MKLSKNILVLLIAFVVITLLSFASCKKGNDPAVSVTKTTYSWNKFVMGADLSFTNQLEDNGVVFKDSGVAKDPFILFKQHGCNLIRVRLWNNPQWEKPYTNGSLYSNILDVEKTILRAKAAGMAVNLDIHYSDTWADPQHQTIRLHGLIKIF